MADELTFREPKGTTAVNTVISVLIAGMVAMALPSVGLLAASPLLTMDHPAAPGAAVAVGIGATLAATWVLVSRARLAFGGAIVLRDAWFELGPRAWPVRIAYDRVTTIRTADALGTVVTAPPKVVDLDAPAGHAPPSGASTLHLAGRGFTRRLTFTPADAQACAEALLARCPAAVLLDAAGTPRPGSAWTPAHRETTAAFYRRVVRRQTLMGGFLLFIGATSFLGGLASGDPRAASGAPLALAGGWLLRSAWTTRKRAVEVLGAR